jgi:ABC-type multidrug transport system fused ATPase/permease subunit
MIDDKD